jgi:hypothetical protein
MLRKASALLECRLAAANQELGMVENLFFDDRDWVLRYLIVGADRSDGGRSIAVLVDDLVKVDWDDGVISLGKDPEKTRDTSGFPSAGEIEAGGDDHLRSFIEVMGYIVQARDGAIGRVTDFVVNDYVDDQPWRIDYFVLDPGGGLVPAGEVILAPHWIEAIDGRGHEIRVDLKGETIRSSPGFDPDELSRETS